MSVFAVDLGNYKSVVSVARKGGVDIVFNEVSKRETASAVGYTDGMRTRGDDARAGKVRNLRNTVDNFKRILGVKAGTQRWDIERRFIHAAMEADDTGFAKFVLNSQGEEISMSTEQIIATYLRLMQSYANIAVDTSAQGITHAIQDVVLSVPVWYNVQQRTLLKNAASIAGLNCLGLMNETTAIALDWGIYKTADLPEGENNSMIVFFVDMGHGHTTISSVAFWKEKTNGFLKVLGHAYDKDFGGRIIDERLTAAFRERIIKEYRGLDVFENKRARVRLQDGCEKVKQMLSANAVAPLNLECLMNEVDVNFDKIHREELEAHVRDDLPRLTALVHLAMSQVPEEDRGRIHSVEVVGGTARVPIFRQTLQEAFGRPLSCTTHATECVAKGLGIMAAMLSPRLSVRPFGVAECVTDPLFVGLVYPGTSSPAATPLVPEVNKILEVVRPNSEYPAKKFYVKRKAAEPFPMWLFYDAENNRISETTNQLLLGHYIIGNIPKADPPHEVTVTLKIDPSGIPKIEGASVSFEEQYTEKTKKKVPKVKPEGEAAAAAEGDAKPAEEFETIEEDVIKTRRKDVACTVEYLLNIGLDAGFITQAAKLEEKLCNKDVEIMLTQDTRNAVESYIYEYRSKISASGPLSPYTVPEHVSTFSALCDATESWLFGDGENAPLAELQAKLADLKAYGDAAENRRRLREALPFEGIPEFNQKLTIWHEENKKLKAREWITPEENATVDSTIEEAGQWFATEHARQEALPLWQEPTLTVSVIKAKIADVDKVLKPIFSRPAPPKPAEAAPAPTPETSEPPQPKSDLD